MLLPLHANTLSISSISRLHDAGCRESFHDIRRRSGEGRRRCQRSRDHNCRQMEVGVQRMRIEYWRWRRQVLFTSTKMKEQKWGRSHHITTMVGLR